MQQSVPAPPPPPAIAGSPVQVVGIPTSPTAVYQGFVAQRSELRDQLEGLQDQRRELSRQLQDPMVTGAARAGLGGHIAVLDARISAPANSNAPVAANDGSREYHYHDHSARGLSESQILANRNAFAKAMKMAHREGKLGFFLPS